MSVYVDDGKYPYRGMIMCHMVADSRSELLEMADDIGVARRHIQASGTYREHFDICHTKRTRAVAAGAIPVTQRQLAQILVQRREGDRAVWSHVMAVESQSRPKESR